MKEIVSKDLCTGCSACLNKCPKNAISMVEGNEGFKYPFVDENKCINCGLCKNICPVINTKENGSLNICFVGYNKDKEVLLSSSSGGIFSLFADYVIENGGIVIGAALDNNLKCKHIVVNDKNDLYKLRGSKYLQSDLEDVFKIVKENIENKLVLFSGTPCQISGLRAYLKNDYNNLICIDLICHGVPTPKLFDKYIKEIELFNNDEVIDYNFRDKSTGWDTYSNNAIFSKDNIITMVSENPYMKLFLSDIALRKSCYDCNFKIGNKYLDITLGDFWGVKDFYQEMYNRKGVSCIIVNTEKGLKVFEKIKDNICYKKCKLQEIIKGNPSLKLSAVMPKNRDKFFVDLDKIAVENLTKKYKRKTTIIKKFKCIIERMIKMNY